MLTRFRGDPLSPVMLAVSLLSVDANALCRALGLGTTIDDGISSMHRLKLFWPKLVATQWRPIVPAAQSAGGSPTAIGCRDDFGSSSHSQLRQLLMYLS